MQAQPVEKLLTTLIMPHCSPPFASLHIVFFCVFVNNRKE